nr:monodehydroascorbate reductase [Tanacetum cinerariifolium]
MADITGPSGQAPVVASPVRADEEIVPRIRWVQIRKNNCSLDLDKKQSNPIFKMAVDLLMHTNFHRAFTASSNTPSIYIQQFWDTIQYDKKAGSYRCQLDEQWFVLTKDTLREALQITPINNNQAFVAPPSAEVLVDFVNQLGHPKLVRNVSNIVTNDMFQPWRALTTIINLCLTGKTSGFERPRLRQAESVSAHNWKKRASLILIPSIRFTNLIIHHLQMRHKFHPRPDSPLHLSDDEPVLECLKFSAKGTKREVFRMPIPGSLITANIREASYYQECQEYVAKHRRFLAGKTGSAQDSPAPKPAKPTRKPKPAAQKAPPGPSVSTPVASAQPAPTSAPAKPQENKRKQATKTTDKPAKAKRIKHSAASKTRKPKSSPKFVATSEAKEVPTVEPRVADEDTDYQKALEESMKTAYALPRGPLPPVVIRKPESKKYQPLPEVPGKGKAKVTEEQVAHDLLSLQKAKRKSLVQQYILQKRIFEPAGSSFRDESPYAALGQSDSEEESKNVMLGATEGGNDEDQAGSNLDEMSEGQVGPDPGNAGNEEQSIPSHVVHAGSDRERIDLDVTDVSPQPSTEQLDEGFLATAYPKIQECLKLAVEEHVSLEEPASSSRTLFSLHHLSRDISFGDQFFSNKPSDADKNAETKVESMVNVPIQQALSSISPMASPIIDLTSRPVSPDPYICHISSPKVHQQFKATTTDTTTTTTTTVPPPTAQQQSSTEAIMIKRIGELEHIMDDLLKVNKEIEARAPRASGSSQSPPPPPHPPPSTSQESPSKGSAAPSPSKTAASAEYQAWTMPDVTLRPFISLTPADLEMDEDMGPDEQAQLSNDEDIGS